MWCHVPSLVRKKIWFGQRGGLTCSRVWCCSGAQFGQRELGQFLDNQDLHHRKSKCIMSAMAMWCHVPSLVRNKFCLAKGHGLIGSRVWWCFGAQFGQTQVGLVSGQPILGSQTSTCIMSTLAMWCHVPSLVINKFHLATGEGLKGSNKSCWYGAQFGQTHLGQFLHNQDWITKLQVVLCQTWPCDAVCQVL